MSVQDTSLEAFRKEVEPKLGAKQRIVMDVFNRAKRPVCNQELADHLRQPINTITPRVNELRALGLVELGFKAIYPKTRRRVIYWRKSQ